MFADPSFPVDESSVLYQNPVRRKFGGRQKFRCRQKFCKTCRRKFSSSPKYWPQPGRVRRKGSGRPKGVFPDNIAGPHGIMLFCFLAGPLHSDKNLQEIVLNPLSTIHPGLRIVADKTASKRSKVRYATSL